MLRDRAASADDIEIASIFAALKANAPRLLIVSVALGAATFAVLLAVAPKYQSQSEMAIVARGASGAFNDSRSGSGGADVITTRMDKEAINTHVRTLQSSDLAEKIAAEMKLKDRPEFNSALGPVDLSDRLLRWIGIGGPRGGETEHDRVLNAFYRLLEVYSAKESRFIGIRFTSVDPELAAEIPNRIAETYRASLATQGVAEVDEQQKVLQAKIDKLSPEVAAAETEVERYRGEINVFKGGSQNTGLNEQQLSELTGELTKAKAARSEADARSKSAREMMKLGSADALPDVQKSPLIQNLVQQRVRIERQISELSAALLPAHPRMRQLQADLAGLKIQLTSEIGKLVDSLDKESRVAQGREESIKRSLDELKANVVSGAPEEARLRQIEAQVRAKRTELESLQAQLEANRKRLDTRVQAVEAQIITKAKPSSVPVSPKKGSLSALVALATMLLGTAWTVTRALFTGARPERNPVAAGRLNPARRLPVAAEPVLRGPASDTHRLPIVEVADAEPDITARDNPPEPLVVLTAAAIAARISAAASEAGGHRTLLTSGENSESTAREAVDLAVRIAENGRPVILIDWTPGEGADGAAAGPGIAELMSGTAGFEDVIQRLPASEVHYIGWGEAGEIAASDFDPDQINLILDALDEAYDYIIVNGPRDAVRDLFETIEGRFDAAVVINTPGATFLDRDGHFLGFDVAGIDIMTSVRPGAASASGARRSTPQSKLTGVRRAQARL